MNELANKNKAVNSIASLDLPVETLAQHFVKSGFFADAKDLAQAIVKIQYGKELGIQPMTSMTGIHVIKGKPVLGAGLLATVVQRSGAYTYKVERLDDTGCTLVFYRGTEKLGVSSFTVQDATKAGLAGNDNYRKYGRNMYFARAIANGVRWYCPEVTGGPVYTFEEMTNRDPSQPEPEPSRRAVENTADALGEFNKSLDEQEAPPEVIDQQPAETLEEWAARTDKIAQANGWGDPEEYEEARREAFKLKGVSPWTAATLEQRKAFEDSLGSGKMRTWWDKKKTV